MGAVSSTATCLLPLVTSKRLSIKIEKLSVSNAKSSVNLPELRGLPVIDEVGIMVKVVRVAPRKNARD